VIKRDYETDPLSIMEHPKDITFDIEADGYLHDATKIHCISISLNGLEPVCYTDIDKAITILKQGDTLIGHNIILYDLPLLDRLHDFHFAEKVILYDTLTLAKIVWPDIFNKDSSLNNLPKKYWGRYSLRSFGYRLNMHKGEMTEFETYSPEMGEYCNQDVRVTNKLYLMLRETGISARAAELEMGFAELASEMEMHGIHFDIDAALGLYSELLKEKGKLLEVVESLVPPKIEELRTPKYWLDTETEVQYAKKGDAPIPIRKYLTRGPNKVRITPFNPLSRQQVAAYLISQGWTPKHTTVTGKPKVDEGTLKSIRGIKGTKELASLYRLSKMMGMLAEGKEAWLKLVRGNRIHPHLNTIGTVSGRTSCVRPNLQQVPSARLPYGKECRQLFTASPDMCLIGADASSLEVRCFAHYMSKFDNNEFASEVVSGDIHQFNADLMKCDRQTAKNTFFALIYGASYKKIASMLGIKQAEARELTETLFEERPAMQSLINSIKRAANTRGYLLGLDGRKLIPRSIHSSVNLLIQAAGSCVSKQAAVNFHDVSVRMGWWLAGTRLVGFIHDEVLIETTKEMAPTIKRGIVGSFVKTTRDFKLRCPMNGESKQGMTWYDVH
tara:strand:+ start:334 stop:2172 length:1839 start_codon:yes stop_codon:yes gene_type:complete